MKELYRVPVGKQYIFVIWECAGKRFGAVFDEINGTMSSVITI